MFYKIILLLLVYNINALKVISDINFKQYIQKESWLKSEINDIYPILSSIESACMDINRLIKRVSINNLSGLQNNINIQGEEQTKLDLLSNNIMKTAICCSSKVNCIVSEEDNTFLRCSDITDNVSFNGEYVVVFDPLDGSSNVGSGLPVGTIFGIYKKNDYQLCIDDNTIKQKGSNLILAGYCLYSASTNLVIAYEKKVNHFMYDDLSNQFILINTDIKIPNSGNIFSFNEANYESWFYNMKSYIKNVKKIKKYTSRYMGALVADTHNILINGGIFGYPDSNILPNGKLRLVYEANPLSYIIESAGGRSTNGHNSILELPVNKIHQRTPLFIGSKEDITLLEHFYK